MIQLYAYTFRDGKFNEEATFQLVENICKIFTNIQGLRKKEVKAVNVFLNFSIRLVLREESMDSYHWERILELAEQVKCVPETEGKKSALDQLIQKSKDEELLTFYYEFLTIREDLPGKLPKKLRKAFRCYTEAIPIRRTDNDYMARILFCINQAVRASCENPKCTHRLLEEIQKDMELLYEQRIFTDAELYELDCLCQWIEEK
ncbi:MAG: hypothetical protein SOU16_01410 [Faecalimonas sp.]|nr:hypothetical protein [Faecalimonas sp.]